MGHTRAAVLVVVLAVAVLGLATDSHAQLQNGFYKNKCGGNDVEAVVRAIVKARFDRDNAIVAHLLRLLFHECGINGCDGGLLIDGPGTEKTASSNLGVKGYDLITTIKTELEKRCPGVVSCSDIEILATRDAVNASTGQGYAVRTGRRDRRRSIAAEVKLPGSDYSVPQAAAFFRSLGLTSDDMVVLLGAHTVGVTHCSVIKKSRLYSFGGKLGATDPSMDPEQASVYKKYVCPNTTASDNNIVYLDDRSSASKLDNSFFKMVQRRRAALLIDQNLYGDGSTRWMVDRLANTDHFRWLFPQALSKLGEVNVLTGTQGEVRRACGKFN